MDRFNAYSVDVDLSGLAVHVNTLTLEISDNGAVAMKNGRPDGWLQGGYGANGEMVLFIIEVKKIIAQAKEKGSFQALEPFDVTMFAKAGETEFKVEILGVKLKISSLLNIDKSSNERSLVTVPYDVTGEVKIDGVPYGIVEE